MSFGGFSGGKLSFSLILHLEYQANCVYSFSVSDVFANAKVMLFATLTMMLRAYARSDVMFAHCAEGTTSFTQ